MMSELTVAGLIRILQEQPQDALVINSDEKEARVFLGKENKEDGKTVVLIVIDVAEIVIVLSYVKKRQCG